MQMNDPMIPAHGTIATRATMTTEAVTVVGGVTETARTTMIVSTAITTEDTVMDATTSAMAVTRTGGARAAHLPTEPYG